MNQQAQKTEIFTFSDEILPTPVTKKMYDNNELIIDYKQYYLYEKCLYEIMETNKPKNVIDLTNDDDKEEIDYNKLYKKCLNEIQTIKPKTQEQKFFINVIIELKEYLKTQNIKHTFYNKKIIKIKPTSKYFYRYYDKKKSYYEIEELNEIYRLKYLIKNTTLKGNCCSVDILRDLMNLQTEIKNNKEYKSSYDKLTDIKERLQVLVFNHYRYEINDGFTPYLKKEHQLNKNGTYNYIVKDYDDLKNYKREYYETNDIDYVKHIEGNIQDYIYDNIEIQTYYNKTIQKQTEFKYRYIYSILNIKSYDKITKKTSNRNCNTYYYNDYSFRGGWCYDGIKSDELKFILKQNGYKAKDFKGKKYGDLVEMYMKL